MNARLLLVLIFANCAADFPAQPDCRRSEDCDTSLCVSGVCQSLPGPDLTAFESWADAAAAPRTSSTADSRPTLCQRAVPASAETIALNEVLTNVPTGPEGDANGDGTRDAFDDEFVELVNIAREPVDMSGVRISSGGKLKHTFEPLCLPPGDAVVVFGGGSVGPSIVGSALIAERRFAFPNDGGTVEVAAPTGVIARFDYGRGPAASFTRLPQLVGAAWVSHIELSSLAFSPGLCPDGSPLGGGCTPTESGDVGVAD